MGEKQEYDPNIGPALAILAAAQEGNAQTIYSAVAIAGVQQLTDSCTELARRMIINAELNLETSDLTLVFHWATKEKGVWLPASIRYIDRFAWSPARRLGIYFTGSVLQHYIDQGGATDEEWESGDFTLPARLRLDVTRMRRGTQRVWALALAYSMVVISEAIADYDDADLDERIKAYRARAATEMLVTPA